jgi:pimeloyl-ACP methyl ester carboxylesterase
MKFLMCTIACNFLFFQCTNAIRQPTEVAKEYSSMKRFNHKSGAQVSINGADIYFERIGAKGKPVLLMLHGGFENIENLNSIAEYLADDFAIIGVDSRGHGKSTLGDKKLSYQMLQNDIETLLRQFSIDTISIVGFSDGGIIGLRIAASKSLAVKKLVTIGSSWSLDDVMAQEELIKTVTHESAKEMFRDNFEQYLQLNPHPEFEIFSQALVEMWLDKSETGHPGHLVEKISASALLIRGDNDFLVSHESLARLQGKIKGSILFTVPFAQHNVVKEQPEALKEALSGFLLTN